MAPLLTQTAFAANVDVCPSGCTYSTIQDGINGANSGDIINVAAGNYDGSNINVNKSVSLIGAPGATVNVPNVNGTNGFSITANNVTIKGFDIVGPADGTSYQTYSWGNTVTRGIAVMNGVTGFDINHNDIRGLRNDVLIDGRNSGSLTDNTVDNSKSGVSVQYTDAGTGNSEGYTITMSGNHDSTYGNEWGLNTHLNGHYIGSTYYSNSQKIATDAPSNVQQALLANSAANGGWTVQDQGYSNSNRTAVSVATAGSDSNQGSPLAPLATIPTAITSIVSGGKVTVAAGSYTVTSANTINKQVDIEGQSKPTINTSGNAQIFTFTAAGSKLNGFTITKTDNADQNIIGIQANNTTISNNDFSGQFTIASGTGTTRALEISSTAATGLNVSNNTFNNLRQPAYINNTVTGTITNNYVNQTKGWVIVSDTNLTFTGNSWGQNAGGTDIAIISQNSSVNNYTCPVMAAIRSNNNNAVIDNQVMSSACPITDAPTNLTPADGTYTTDPAFSDTWSTVSGAAKYEYQTSHTKNGTNLGSIIYSDDSTSSNYSISGNTVTRHNSGTPDGDYYWRVRAVNADGDAGPWSVINKVTVDTAKPAKPTLQTPPNNGYENTNNFYFTWTDSSDSGSPVTYEFKSSQNSHTTNGVLDTGVWDNIDNGNSEQSNLTSPKIHSTGAPDGPWYWQVRAIDAAGNKSDWTSVWKMTIDTQPPAAPSLVSPHDGAVVNGSSITQSWSDTSSDVDHYIYESYNDANATNVRFTGTYNTTSKTATNVAATTYWWRVKAVDKAGNVSGWSPLWKITVDNTAPAVPTNLTWTDSNGHNVASGGYTNLSTGTASWQDSSSDVDHYIYKYWNNISSSAYNSESHAWTTTAAGASLPGVFNQGEGTHFFCVEAVDGAGNTSACSTPFSITYDTTAPAEPVANPGAGTYSSTQLVSLSSNDENGNTTIYYTTDGSTPSKTSTLYTGAFSVSSTETIKAIAYDQAGNASSVLTAAYTITTPAPTQNQNQIQTQSFTTPRTFFASAIQGGTGGGANGVNGNSGTAAGGNGGANGQVLGASTTNGSDSGTTSDGTVSVKSASTKKDTPKTSSAFLGLGWWWLAILAIAFGLFYSLFRRADGTDRNA